MTRYLRHTAFAGALWGLCACSADTSSVTPPLGPCNSEAAQSLVGKSKPTDSEALHVTGSRTVRQIEPGQMVTHDFREERVTIEADPNTGLVTGARCG